MDAEYPPRSKETALVVLEPEESGRLLGRAVAALPQVQRTAASGRMVIVGGSTTRHVVHALTGEDPGLAAFAVGWIHHGELSQTPEEGRGPGPFLFDQGRRSRGWPGPLLERFGPGDIYVKGANAIDPDGHVAILMGSPNGGTIGAAWTLIQARGGELIIPISLRKLIPSVSRAGGKLGIGKVDRVMGMPVGMMPIPAGFATVVTEVTACALLFGVEATLVASGGVERSSGALVLHLAGAPEAIARAWETLAIIREETREGPRT